jgi:alkanesulfonate monooxygenase SsuD/methylene tetrahydromethanopterin reductase-like flavin-dependent oxidoreductase (luciferase family)
VRYGLSIPNFAEPSRLVELAVAAERAGWDGFFLWDHIVVNRSMSPPISDPWTTLGAVAVMTSRVRLGTLVTPVPRRRPWVLARQVCTVDHLSGGRAVLGVGLGVPPEEEYAALGEPADPKGHARVLDEALTVIDALWSGEAVDHHGTYFNIDGVRFNPRPVQRPRVPIWCAASLPSTKGVRRGARWDGVAPIYSVPGELRPVTPEEVGRVVTVLEAEGAPPAADVVVWAVAPDSAMRLAYEQAGATWLVEGPAPGPDWFDDAIAIAAGGPPATSD